MATVSAPPEVATGVNDRIELAEADSALRNRIRHDLMWSGVTIVAPETVVIDAGVSIEPDTTILSGSAISNGTRIGRGCTVGPNAVLSGATLADGAVVGSSTMTDSYLGEGVHVGQYALIRGNSRLEAGVRIGTHAEINRAVLGRGVRVGHFSYLGDVTSATTSTLAPASSRPTTMASTSSRRSSATARLSAATPSSSRPFGLAAERRPAPVRS